MVPFVCKRWYEGNSVCARPHEGESAHVRSGARAGTCKQDSVWGIAWVRVRKREVTYMRGHMCEMVCMQDSAHVDGVREMAREGERARGW